MINHDIKEGMTVRDLNGEKLGKVIACQADGFVIEKGFFFPKDYKVAYGEVSTMNEDGDIILALDEDTLKAGGTTLNEPGDTAAPLATGSRARDADSMTLSEEELAIEKRMKETGEVRLRKDVVTEHKQVTVPVTKEQVVVERVPVGKAAEPGQAAFRSDEISIPVREEEIEVRKRPVVREEVRVRKDVVQEQRTANADLRRETLDVEGDAEQPAGTGYDRGKDFRKV